jgi:hypothetical protein
MENGVVNGGKKRKGQEIEDSANANDVWVWMRQHIGFCTIGRMWSPFFLFSIESLQIACRSHPLSLFLEIWSFSNEVLPLLLFDPSSFSLFFRIRLLLGRDSTHWNFLGESLGK